MGGDKVRFFWGFEEGRGGKVFFAVGRVFGKIDVWDLESNVKNILFRETL